MHHRVKFSLIIMSSAFMLAACSGDRGSPHPDQPAASTGRPSSVATDVGVAAAPSVKKNLEGWEAWRYETAELDMGGYIKIATIESSNTLEFDSPYDGSQRGLLALRDSGGIVETIVQIEKGQIQCHSYRLCSVLVRINDEPAQQYDAVGPADNSSTSIFIHSDTLPGQIAQAQRVRIQIPTYRQGQPVLEFKTHGFNSSIWLDSTVGVRR